MDLVGRSWLALLVAGGVGLFSCSSEKPGTGSGGDVPLGGSGGTSGGAGSDGLGGTGGAGNGSSCTTEILSAKPAPLDLFVMLDASASMAEPTGGGLSRWAAVSSALVSFSKDAGSAGVGIGVGAFPIDLDLPDSCTTDSQCRGGAPCIRTLCLNTWLEFDRKVECETDADCEDGGSLMMPTCRTIGDCETAPEAFCFVESPSSCRGVCTASGICSRFVSCDADDFSEPIVPITESPGVETTLSIALQRRTPQGETTSAPALIGALEHAQGWKDEHPERDVVTVFVTGGPPTECLGDGVASSADAIAELGEIAADAAGNGMRTFVVAVLGAEQASSDLGADLDSVARAGGTDGAFFVDSEKNVSSDVWLALNRIRTAERGCEFAAPSGDGVDYDKVNLSFVSGAATTRIPRVEGEAACDAIVGGWYYDVVPGAGEPERLVVCPKSCDALQAAAIGAPQLELGCDSEFLD